MAKKIPLRMCLGCREMKAKKELVRIVKSPASEIALDFGGKMPGRGAYVCRDTDCFNRVVKSKALSRALKMQIPDEALELLKKETGINGE